MLADLLSRGLASGKVIAVYSAILDTIVRRAISLIFADHPELSVDAFTWLSLGSNGRREAVLGSDVDSAVAFVDAVPADDRPLPDGVRRGQRRAGQARVSRRPRRHRPQPVFARTNADWRAARSSGWRPRSGQGRDDGLPAGGRPADPRRPRAAGGDAGVRRPARHPGTMRLLLQEALSRGPGCGPCAGC